MRETRRARAGRVALVVLGVAVAAPARGEEAGEAISVRIVDYAGLPAPVVAAAAGEAGQVLARAGIAVAWTLCPSSPACGDPLGAGDLQVEILARRHATRAVGAGTLGYAVLPEDGSPGVLASLLWSRIAPQARDTSASLPQILGHVAAHEIAHLLLGTNDHALSGLMAAQILGRDFDRAAAGALRFSSDEAERMRAGARRRREAAAVGTSETVRTASAR